MGARSAADASPLLPLSRQGADASFQTLSLDAAIEQPLARSLAVAVYARGQTAFGQALTSAEQFSLNASRAVTALPSGTIQGDEGYSLRGELQTPLPLRGGDILGSLTP